MKQFGLLVYYINNEIDGKKLNIESVKESDIIYAIEKGVSLYSIKTENIEQDKEKESKGI